MVDAVVDHPPRRLAFGARLAEMHYGELLFARLHGLPITRTMLLRRLTRARFRAMWLHPGVDIVPALASWVTECVHVWRRWSAWEQASIAAARSQ